MSSSSPPPSSSPLRNVASFPFVSFSRLLSRLSDLRRADKLRRACELFQQLGYVQGAEEGGGAPRPNLFPLLRLLLPQLDTERATYGLRESSLADMYVAALSLDRLSAVAQRLKNFKQPHPQPQSERQQQPGQRGGAVVAGDFASVLLDVLRPRERVHEGASQLSIADVNARLDDIAAAPDRAGKQAVFVQLIGALSASEHFWLVRVILKDLKVGLKHETLLRLLHPQAVDVYNSCSSLRHVSDLLTDTPRLVAEACNVGYFRPFKPMLATSPSDWHNIPHMMDGRRYVIEDKFDGERLIVHKRGSDVRLYTRKSIDVTHRYGYGAALAATLLDCIAGDAIVDGELMSWDLTLQRYVPFGNNRTTALLGEHTNRQLTYLVFDLVMDGDTLVIDRPLVDRRRRLQQLVKEKEHAVELVRTREARADNQFLLDHLNDAVYRGMEGLLLKAAGGHYVLNDRSASWIKFKPDFVSGLHDTLDLLLEGTRRGRAGDISHFLLAVVDAVNLQAGEQPRRIYTFCKVGSGYTIPELTDLRDRLRDKWRPYDKRRSPAWLQGWRPELSDVPDVVIEPRDSVLVEVKCYEIIPCPASKFLAEFTCRFPRVIRFRWNDKEWFEAESIDRIRQLAAQDRVKGRKMDDEAAAASASASAGSEQSPPHSPVSDVDDAQGGSSQLDRQWGLAGQLAASQDGSADGQGGRKRTRRRTMADEAAHEASAAHDGNAERAIQRQSAAGGVLPLFQAASGLSGIERRSSVLAGLSLVVMVQPDCQPSKAELERLVVEHGGEVRQNPPAQRDGGDDRRCVLLSDGQSSYKLQAHQRSGRFDIVHFSWLVQCVKQGRLSRYKHDHIISATAATSSERSRQVDRHGDDYTEDLYSVADSRRIVDTVRQHTMRIKQQTAHIGGDTLTDSLSTVLHPQHGPATRVVKICPTSPTPYSASAALAAALCPASPPPAACAATAEDAVDLSCSALLEQADSAVAGLQPRLFDAVHAALHRDDEQTADSQQAVDAAIVQCALSLHGATLVSDGSAGPLTHCVVWPAAASASAAASAGCVHCSPADRRPQAVRVTPAWITDSLRAGKRLSETDYSPHSSHAAH